jgi:hypothetical protein
MRARLLARRDSAPRKRGERDPESGYTLLIALLMVATILLLMAAASPNIYIEGRRDRDEEMIWRGQQYVRAIGLYYRKYGHYPHTIDDLTNSDNQIRFLRQAYKDPMNTDDGSWRLIYVGAAGQLINSVMYTNIAQVPGPGGGQGAAGGSTSAGGGAPPPEPGAVPAVGTPGFVPSSDDSQPQPLEGEVIGGNLVGVGSKVKKPSIKVYNGGTTYYQWEFIWKQQAQGAGGSALSTGGQGSGIGASTSSPNGAASTPTNSPMSGNPPAAPDQGTSPGQ